MFSLWKIAAIVCSTFFACFLVLTLFSGLVKFQYISTCDTYSCDSKLTEDDRSVTCFSKVTETKQTFNRFCRWYEGCTRMYCPKQESCYVINNQVFFETCPRNDMFSELFRVAIFGTCVSLFAAIVTNAAAQ